MLSPVIPKFQTLELGPGLNRVAPNFTTLDHARQCWSLESLMGERGLMLGFIGDIWQSVSVRRILWLERHAHTLMRGGVNLGLLICDQPHMLYGFYVSSPTPPPFPLLADEKRDIHKMFNMMQYPGMVMIDRQHIVRHKWLVPDDRVWPRIQDLLDVTENF
ncbi:MAG: peroxiredoxin family protein [Anaerolineae bacterium]|nr:peroxiredoxin family protein [Anaerolineae bacterium]